MHPGYPRHRAEAPGDKQVISAGVECSWRRLRSGRVLPAALPPCCKGDLEKVRAVDESDGVPHPCETSERSARLSKWCTFARVSCEGGAALVI